MTKKQRRAVEKTAKKHPVVFVIIFLLVASIGLCCFLHWKGIIHISFLDKIIPQQNKQENPLDIDTVGGKFTEADITEVKSNDLSIHFLELGNKYTGDCTLIKTGNTEVLIDAGSRKSSAETIKAYVDTFCTDGVLEYVIATHAHQDHIAGFVGNSDGKGSRTGIFYQYEIGTLIQFSQSEATSNLYEEYQEAVSYLQSNDTIVYDALECWKGGNATTGARRTFVLDAEKDITLNILYQKYYEQDASSENDYSVCTLLSEGDNHYLFTGDLEEDGEESLVESNNLPQVRLFKAGHHGSKTSNTDTLLSVIRPEIVCVCCCCGSDEYTENTDNQFPTKKFTQTVSQYTDKVYVTSIVADNKDGYTSMNGNIIILPKDDGIKVRCSNNTTLLKDTEWFAQYRK